VPNPNRLIVEKPLPARHRWFIFRRGQSLGKKIDFRFPVILGLVGENAKDFRVSHCQQCLDHIFLLLQTTRKFTFYIKMATSKMITEDECKKVFETYIAMSVVPEQLNSRRVTEHLTDEELEAAAMRSNAYYVTSLRNRGILTKEIRFATAMRESYRYLDGIDEVQEALKLLRISLRFHKENKSHIYRTCMQEDFQYDNEEDEKLAAKRRMRITKENRDVQAMLIRGQDRHNNAVWVAMPRKKQGDDPEGFVDSLLYTIERCSAATEALTSGRSDRMVAVLDCKNSASPPIKAMKTGIGIMQAHYPGRLNNLIVLDLNYILQGIYNCVKPFLDPDTREKFVIVKGTKAKEAAVSVHIDESQAQTNLLKNGKLSPEIDGEWFVKEVPFHRLYDDAPSKEIPTPMLSEEVEPPLQHSISKNKNKIPTTIKSQRTFKTKSRSLAVGSVTRCMTRITVTPAA
jgi:hypothetical protein